MECYIVVKTTVIGEIFQTFDAAKKVADALAEESTDQKYAYHVVGIDPNHSTVNRHGKELHTILEIVIDVWRKQLWVIDFILLGNMDARMPDSV